MSAAAARIATACVLVATAAVAWGPPAPWTIAATAAAVLAACLPGPRGVWNRVGPLLAVLFAVAVVAWAPRLATWT